MNWNLAEPVFEQSLRTPDALSLVADDVELSYRELAARASARAAELRDAGIGPGRRVGILGSKSLVALEGVLGVLWAGAAYVPLGVSWPESRLAAVAEPSELDALIVDARGAEVLTPRLAGRTPVFEGAGERRGEAERPLPLSSDALAYIIFTSGTTGVPKGVMASVGSVRAYIDALGARKNMTVSDRASQFTELTFDPSIGEILVPWERGASLHVVPPLSQVSPVAFVRERELTIWGAAPAAIAWMRATRSLRDGSMPTLRYSSFGGEPLPESSVRAFRDAAPNSDVDNLYGPTEATVDCVGQYVRRGDAPRVTPGRGVLAIGVPHPGTELSILDPGQKPLPAGEVGELAIAGRQLTLGYLGQPELTRERFPVLDGKRWYLTGDLASRDTDGSYHHLGRADHQVKIRGHRVELEDVEAHLRRIAGTDEAVAVPWPLEDGVVQGVVGFVATTEVAAEEVLARLREHLPPYMVPWSVRMLESLPRTAHGKLDRTALANRLAAEATE